MKMQAIQKRQQFFLKLFQCSPQAGTRSTGIIDGMAFLGGAFRIDPKAGLFSQRPGPGLYFRSWEGELNTR